VVIDLLAAQGNAAPYTWTLVAFTLFSLTAIPLFFLAGRRLHADRERLFARIAGASLKGPPAMDGRTFP
jgi:hypothetical protein